MTKVYLTQESGGTELAKLKDNILKEVEKAEGITSEELATKLKIEQSFCDSLLAELSSEGKVRLYI